MNGLTFPLAQVRAGLILNTGGGAALSFSATSVLENRAAGTPLGALSVSDVGTWVYSVVAGYDAGGRLQVVGNEVRATSTPFVFETSPSYVVRFKAVRTSPYAEITREFTVLVTDVAVLFVPSLDFRDLRNAVYFLTLFDL